MIFCDMLFRCFLVVLSWSQTTKQQLHDTGENLLGSKVILQLNQLKLLNPIANALF